MTKRKRTRRSPQEWRRLVERFEAAGVSQKRFCAAEGLNETTFRLWRSRVRSERTEAAPFVEVVPVPASESPWAIELELPSGVTLRLRG